MTREKEIDVAATHYDYGYYEDSKLSAYCCFRDGAEWADKHPINVWHDTSEEPDIGSNIVAIDKDEQWWDIQPYNNDYDEYGLNGWECCILVYNSIQKWAYIDDLLPKNIKNNIL